MANKVGSDKDVVETVYGKHSVYEIIRSSRLLGSPSYHIYKNGKYHRGAFSSLSAAVEKARQEG